MPIERDRYPANWKEISLDVRKKANWRCEHCGKQCRRSGESWLDFAYSLIHQGKTVVLRRPNIYTLTTAHLDQNPANNEPNNLAALCTPCHLKYDSRFLKANRMAKLERRGQLNLFEVGETL